MAESTGELHAPFFITGPGETDVLMVVTAIFLLVVILLVGVFYLHLHALPDRMAHKANHTQLQLVGILTLLALFTHNHLFWIIALVLVAVQPPDFQTPLNSIARSLRKLAGQPEPAPPEDNPNAHGTEDKVEERRDV